MKPALLIIDVQKKLFMPQTTQSLNDAIRYINVAIELFRRARLPVVCIQHVDQKYGLTPDEPGFELSDRLNVLSDDLHIHKMYKNSFNKTPLEFRLREQNIDTVILTGFTAEDCVLSTYHGAEDCGLTPIILLGALASAIPEHIKFVENISEVISCGALKKALE